MISIIIPNYNYGKYVMSAIQSVLDDPYKKTSIIVSDDCSTDKSVDVILPYIDLKKTTEQDDVIIHSGYIQNKAISVVQAKKNGGPSTARNLGLKYAYTTNCQYIGFLDSDDEYTNNKIGKSLSVLDKYPEVGVVYSDYTTVHPDYKLREYKKSYSRSLLEIDCIINCNSIFRRETAEKNNVWFDPTLRVCEDYDFWLNLTRYCLGYHIPESLFDMKVHQSSSNKSVSKQRWEEDYRKVKEKLLKSKV